MGDCLLQAIAAVLGDRASPAVIDAWGKAYQQLAGILIEAEESVYASNEQPQGGWRNERGFKLRRKVAESSIIS